MERYELLSNISQNEAEWQIKECFPQKAIVYAVLDFEVCFGIYENGCLSVGLKGQTNPVLLDWKYLQELRIFDEEKELLLVPSANGWSGRIRRDMEDAARDEEAGEYIVDEYQKLWGKVQKNNKDRIGGWSLLVSGRGANMQIPVEIEGPEAAIHVRRYMRIPDMEKEEEMVFQKDIRMAALCSWEGE